MRHLNTIIVLFLFLGCHKPNHKHIAIGTWKSCNKSGTYWEYKITDQYILMLNSKVNEVWLFKIKILNDDLILSEFENGLDLMTNNDTLVTVKSSKNKVVLKSTYTWNRMVLNKANFEFEKIDSTNLELWKNKILSEFKKRTEIANCPDLRTESEKETPTIELNFPEEEAIPIEEIEN